LASSIIKAKRKDKGEEIQYKMPIRKGKLKRPCKDCGKMFIPTGRGCWYCDPCVKKRMKRWVRGKKRK